MQQCQALPSPAPEPGGRRARGSHHARFPSSALNSLTPAESRCGAVVNPEHGLSPDTHEVRAVTCEGRVGSRAGSAPALHQGMGSQMIIHHLVVNIFFRGVGETLHPGDPSSLRCKPSSPPAANPAATAPVPVPVSGWCRLPREASASSHLVPRAFELSSHRSSSPEEWAGMVAMPTRSLRQSAKARVERQGAARVAADTPAATQARPWRGTDGASA